MLNPKFKDYMDTNMEFNYLKRYYNSIYIASIKRNTSNDNPNIYSNAKTLGIMSYGWFGNNDYELLTKQACQEYNLSCGRW